MGPSYQQTPCSPCRHFIQRTTMLASYLVRNDITPLLGQIRSSVQAGFPSATSSSRSPCLRRLSPNADIQRRLLHLDLILLVTRPAKQLSGHPERRPRGRLYKKILRKRDRQVMNFHSHQIQNGICQPKQAQGNTRRSPQTKPHRFRVVMCLRPKSTKQGQHNHPHHHRGLCLVQE